MKGGKSFKAMLVLKSKLEEGKNCMVATLNTKKTIDDFKYITGLDIDLTPTEKSDIVYIAKLKN
jgi:hypothetical protein